MATWVAHFYLTEQILAHGFDLDRRMFVVGNIAPDSGVLNEERNGYIPDKSVSHWKNAAGDIDAERFYAECIHGQTFDHAEHAFCLGFYCHLLADVVWTKTLWEPKKQTPLYAKPLTDDPQFIWEIKKDWYGLDFLYLKAHPQSIFYTDFVHVETVPDYLDVFPAGAFTKRVQDTRAFYLNGATWELERPYTYLNQAEWDAYLAEATAVILAALTDKDVSRR